MGREACLCKACSVALCTLRYVLSWEPQSFPSVASAGPIGGDGAGGSVTLGSVVEKGRFPIVLLNKESKETSYGRLSRSLACVSEALLDPSFFTLTLFLSIFTGEQTDMYGVVVCFVHVHTVHYVFVQQRLM